METRRGLQLKGKSRKEDREGREGYSTIKSIQEERRVRVMLVQGGVAGSGGQKATGDS